MLVFHTGNGKTVGREAKDQPERKVRILKVEENVICVLMLLAVPTILVPFIAIPAFVNTTFFKDFNSIL